MKRNVATDSDQLFSFQDAEDNPIDPKKHDKSRKSHYDEVLSPDETLVISSRIRKLSKTVQMQNRTIESLQQENTKLKMHNTNEEVASLLSELDQKNKMIDRLNRELNISHSRLKMPIPNDESQNIILHDIEENGIKVKHVRSSLNIQKKKLELLKEESSRLSKEYLDFQTQLQNTEQEIEKTKYMIQNNISKELNSIKIAAFEKEKELQGLTELVNDKKQQMSLIIDKLIQKKAESQLKIDLKKRESKKELSLQEKKIKSLESEINSIEKELTNHVLSTEELIEEQNMHYTELENEKNKLIQLLETKKNSLNEDILVNQTKIAKMENEKNVIKDQMVHYSKLLHYEKENFNSEIIKHESEKKSLEEQLDAQVSLFEQEKDSFESIKLNYENATKTLLDSQKNKNAKTIQLRELVDYQLKQIEESNKEVSVINDEISNIDLQISQKRDDLISKEYQLKSYTEKIKREIRDKKMELTNIEKGMLNTITKIREICNIRSQISEINDNMSELFSMNSRLSENVKTEFESQNNENILINNRICELKQQNDILQSELEGLEANRGQLINDQKALVLELETKKSDREAMVKEYNQTVLELQANIRSHNEQLKSHTIDYEQNKSQCQLSIQRLNDELVELKKTNDRLDKDHKTNMDHLIAQLKEAKNNHANLTKELKSKEDKFPMFEKRYVNEINEIEENYQKKNNRIKEIDERIETISKSFEAQNIKINNEIQKLDDEIKVKTSELDNLNNKIFQKKELYQKIIEEKESQKSQLTIEYKNKISEYQEFKTKILVEDSKIMPILRSLEYSISEINTRVQAIKATNYNKPTVDSTETTLESAIIQKLMIKQIESYNMIEPQICKIRENTVSEMGILLERLQNLENRSDFSSAFDETQSIIHDFNRKIDRLLILKDDLFNKINQLEKENCKLSLQDEQLDLIENEIKEMRVKYFEFSNIYNQRLEEQGKRKNLHENQILDIQNQIKEIESKIDSFDNNEISVYMDEINLKNSELVKLESELNSKHEQKRISIQEKLSEIEKIDLLIHDLNTKPNEDIVLMDSQLLELQETKENMDQKYIELLEAQRSNVIMIQAEQNEYENQIKSILQKIANQKAQFHEIIIQLTEKKSKIENRYRSICHSIRSFEPEFNSYLERIAEISQEINNVSAENESILNNLARRKDFLQNQLNIQSSNLSFAKSQPQTMLSQIEESYLLAQNAIIRSSYEVAKNNQIHTLNSIEEVIPII